MNKEYKGFLEPIDDGTHWVLGSGNLARTIIEEKGDWSTSLPITERQNQRGIETYNCTGEAITNAIEILMFKQFGIKANYSDRALGIFAGTSAQNGGNDFHTVCEAVRKFGLVPEEMLPFSDNIQNVDEYFSFKGGDEAACRKAGKEWLEKYSFGHEDVFSPSQPLDEKLNNIKIALKSSPLPIAVWAWKTDSRGVYISGGAPNHLTCLYAQNQLSYIFDSYDPFLKLVDQDFLYCKWISINKKEITEQQRYWFTEILRNIAIALGLIKEEVKLLPKPIVENHYEEVKEAIKTPKYLWDNFDNSRHSVRVICDEQGLTLANKNLICAVIQAESNFNNKAINQNKNAKGIVTSTDYGICQINSYYQIGAGKPFSSVEDCVNNPDKAVRFMIQMFKAGKLTLWSAFNNGSYKKFMT